MAMVNRDPHGVPDILPEVYQARLIENRYPVYIICESEVSTAERFDGVSFVAYVHTTPKAGEIITLQDGKMCQVKFIDHTISGKPETGFITVPNILAKFIARLP